VAFLNVAGRQRGYLHFPAAPWSERLIKPQQRGKEPRVSDWPGLFIRPATAKPVSYNSVGRHAIPRRGKERQQRSCCSFNGEFPNFPSLHPRSRMKSRRSRLESENRCLLVLAYSRDRPRSVTDDAQESLPRISHPATSAISIGALRNRECAPERVICAAASFIFVDLVYPSAHVLRAIMPRDNVPIRKTPMIFSTVLSTRAKAIARASTSPREDASCRSSHRRTGRVRRLSQITRPLRRYY